MNCTLAEEGAFTRAQYDALDVALMVGSIVGFFGSVYMIVATGYFERALKASSNPSVHALFWVSVGDVMRCLSYFGDSVLDPRDVVPGLPDSASGRPWSLPALLDGGCGSSSNCKAIGAVNQFTSVFSIVWMIVIDHTLISSSRGIMCAKRRGRLLLVGHLAAWTLSALTVVVIASLNGFGYSGNNCWIKQDPELTWAWFVFYYTPDAGEVLYSMAAYAFAWFRIRQVNDDTANQSHQLALLQDTLQVRIRRIIFVSVVFELLLFSNRLVAVINGHPYFPITILCNLIAPLKSVANAYIYRCNPRCISEQRGRLRRRRKKCGAAGGATDAFLGDAVAGLSDSTALGESSSQPSQEAAVVPELEPWQGAPRSERCEADLDEV